MKKKVNPLISTQIQERNNSIFTNKICLMGKWTPVKMFANGLKI